MLLKLNRSNSRKIYAFFTMFMLTLYMFLGGIQVHAGISEAQAEKNLEQTVRTEVEGNLYTLENGGSIEGKYVFKGNQSSGYDIDEAMFSKLSTSAQKEFISDLVSASNKAVGSAKGVTDATVQNWMKQLQSKEGVGSRFLTEILKNTKPDFVSANAIWKPFAGPLGVFLGILAVGTLSLLGINIMLDIIYITLPMARLFLNNNKEDGKLLGKLVSHAALSAVKEVEEGSDGKGKKQAIGIYFGSKVFELILLGIALLYLVSGNIWTLVGYILDLVSGFLGF